MPLLPGAEPIRHTGGSIAALLIHGLGSTPQSLGGWSEHLADHGYSVSVPRLPGHGTSLAECNRTRWQDWYAETERAFDELHGRCESVFVMGHGMGGTLTLRLAARRRGVAGLVLVNPAVSTTGPERHLLPLLAPFLPGWPRVASDIKRPGVTEPGYERMPVRAAQSLLQLQAATVPDLADVHQPTLIFTSEDDHVVEPENSEFILEHISSRDRHQEMLEQSYHVATLDNDAEYIFAHSRKFIERLTG